MGPAWVPLSLATVRRCPCHLPRYLLPFPSLGERAILLPFEMKEGLLKNAMELRQCSLEDALEWVDDLGRRGTATWRVYQTLQELCNPRIFVDKTPHNADHVSFLEHAQAIFANARYCHLVRHPYSSISSGVELRRDILMNPNVTWGEVEEHYITSQENIIALFDAVGVEPDACDVHLRVRYEELLRSPRATLSFVVALVGLNFQAGMDEPYDSADAVASFQAASLGAGADPKLMRCVHWEAIELADWPSWTAHALRSCGYLVIDQAQDYRCRTGGQVAHSAAATATAGGNHQAGQAVWL